MIFKLKSKNKQKRGLKEINKNRREGDLKRLIKTEMVDLKTTIVLKSSIFLFYDTYVK